MDCPSSYNIDANGIVRVNGGVPSFSSDAMLQKAKKAWQLRGSDLSVAASQHGVPLPWLFGIMMAETGGVLDCSPCQGSCCETHGKSCCAFGVMQFIPSTARRFGVTPEDLLLNPALSISVGAMLLHDLLSTTQGDLVKATALYNAGSLRCDSSKILGYYTEGQYSYEVVRWSNTFIQFSAEIGAYPKMGAAALILAGGLVAAGAIYGGFWKPSWAM